MTDVNSEGNISAILKKAVRVFISYSTEDKQTAGMIQNKYGSFNIESFLAHEDLKVSEEWKERIIQELNRTDVIVALLSKNFRSSDWTSQEIGFALQRKLLCIPLSLDETQPYGFFGHLQGKKISKAPANSDLERHLIPPLLGKFPSVRESIIQKLETVGNYRYAEEVMGWIIPSLNDLSVDQVNKLIETSCQNNQIWAANLCQKEYLPKIIERHRTNIRKNLLNKITKKISLEF